MKPCNCNMYQTQKICWHTGYKPKFYTTNFIDKILNAVARAAEKDAKAREESLKPQ